MKLHSLTTLNAIDPLPKLGKKVQPKNPESPEAIRAREVEAFERGVYNAVKAAAEETGLRNFARSFAHDGTGYIEPEPVVSFADAAEMADGWIKWGGGQRPVSRSACIEIKFRDGSEGSDKYGLMNDGFWRHFNDARDIIAYRVIKHAAEVVEKAVTWGRVHEAYNAASKRRCELYGPEGAMLVHSTYLRHGGSSMHDKPHTWPAAIAALEALR